MMEGVAARLLSWQRGLTGWHEARQRVYSHTGESQDCGRAGPQAGAGSTASAGASLPRRHRGPQIGINSIVLNVLMKVLCDRRVGLFVIALQGQEIVATLVPDVLRDGCLTAHRIDGDNTALEG